MKKIIIAAAAASLLVTSVFAEEANCTSDLKERDFTVKVNQEYKGVSSKQLFDQAEKVKEVKPLFLKEIKTYTKMLKASDEAYQGVTTVDRVITEVCSEKGPLWKAMSTNQKTLMIGIDGTPNPYMRKTAFNSSIKDLKKANTNLQRKNALAIQNLKRAHATDVKALKRTHLEDIESLTVRLNAQSASLTTLTASKHPVGVYNTAKFHGFETIDFKNGETGICSSGVSLKAAEQVDLYAICLVDGGKYGGVPNVIVYEGYSVDSSDRIDFVRLPYTIISYKMPIIFDIYVLFRKTISLFQFGSKKLKEKRNEENEINLKVK